MSAQMASQFDPSMFLDATVTEPTVRRPPLNVGDYTGIIKDIKGRTWVKKDDATRTGIALDVQVEIQVPPDQQTRIGQPVVLLTHGVMIDTTESGALDNAPGKNRGMRNYRDATDLNHPGQAFSFRMLVGRVLKFKITHRLHEGEVFDQIEAPVKG